jgi:hypothetical protein
MYYAESMEVCPPWLKSATLNHLADTHSNRLTKHFGRHYVPEAGETMAYFSTGIAADETDYGFVEPQDGTAFQGRENNPLAITSTNVCTGTKLGAPAIANDMVALTMQIQVPTNAKAFQFNFNFFSSEYPEYVGGQYNDMFIAYLQSKKYTGNISFDANNNPVTVNSGFFQVCCSSPICANGGHTCAKDICPQKGPRSADLDGTGYELPDHESGQPIGGGTDWLTTTAPVEPGEVITLTLFVFDSGDHFWDSAVLLDGFKWLFQDDVSGPMTGLQ